MLAALACDVKPDPFVSQADQPDPQLTLPLLVFLLFCGLGDVTQDAGRSHDEAEQSALVCEAGEAGDPALLRSSSLKPGSKDLFQMWSNPWIRD